ncbi:MAG TPA: DUF488 domain-containing protein [Acetobacteraceae bacterium]|jgi:uncharacterized protein (DUF488 family)
MADQPREVLTIGHSSHSMERFLELLHGAGATAVADVRSAPYSRHVPQFNHDALKAALRAAGVAYVHLGKELGGRPQDRSRYRGGVVDYEHIARTPVFEAGLQRVLEGAATHRVALMCAEADPLDCHRCLLIARALAAGGVPVRHVLADGAMATHAELEDELLRRTRRAEDDLFLPRTERIAVAYQEHARRVGYAETDADAG